MKKLLSLLSVLTISGSAVPTTIAASSYQKEETIKNSDINYQQINNLEKLNRGKRNSNKIFSLNNENGDQYRIGISSGLLYFMQGGSGTIRRVTEINEKVNDVLIDSDKNAYIIGESLNIYFIMGLYGQNDSEIITIDFSLIKEWKSNFDSWKNQIILEENNSVSQMNLNEQNNWKNRVRLDFADKLHSLNQNLSIIKNNLNILKLNIKFRNLVNDFNNVNNKINDLTNKINNLEIKLKNNQNQGDCIANSLKDNTVGNAAGGLVSGAVTGIVSGAVVGSFAPGIGTVAGAIVGGIIGLISGAAGGLAYGTAVGVINC